MSLPVLAGAFLLAASIPVAWFAVSGRRPAVLPAALQRGLAPVRDVRALRLEEQARSRAIAPLIRALAARARRLTPAGAVDKLEERLVASGYSGRWTIEQVLAAKLGATAIVAVYGGIFAVVTGFKPVVVLGVVIALGMAWFAVDAFLDGRAADRQKAVRLQLADTMDQITIAVEAGLGFESAIGRIAADTDTILAAELSRTLQDIQLGMPRAEALAALSNRIDIPELRHFVTAVRQAERYGLPIANVLRVQSAELREKRRQAAEEQAMKIPVKILFPLIFCIFPTIFIVLVGPVGLRFADVM